VDPEHLALDVIDEIGPGNAFIKSKHTRKHMLSEYYTTNGVTNRKRYERWVGDGSPDTWTRARSIAQAILSESEQSYLPESVDAWIRKTYDIRL
jgi:trimethylamine--corrinoid protein Co-methyltransferase